MSPIPFSELNCSAAELLESMQGILRQAGDLAQSMQSDCWAQAKSPRDVITEADHASDALILQWINQNYPQHNCWLEESGWQDRGSDRTWMVDPIDGTVNFSRGGPLWGVALALLYKGEVIFGAAYLPALREMYGAVKGGGAWLGSQKLQVSQTSQMDLALISNGDVNVGEQQGHAKLNDKILGDWKLQAQFAQRVKCFGSAVLEGCFVASGRLDAYVMRLSHPWDIAAVSLLVSEAGGRCSQIESADFEIRDLCTCVMSNGLLHQDLLSLLSGREA